MRRRLVKTNCLNRIVLITLGLLLLVGCQMDKRFSRLQPGMTKAEVLAVVGKHPTGDKQQEGVEILEWETGSH